MATLTKLVTADEFDEMPESDGCIEELIAGEVVAMPMPNLEHGAVAAAILGGLISFVQRERLGVVFTPVGFKVRADPDWVVGPDVAFVRTGRLNAINEQRRRFDAAPDLAVEVVSPSNSSTLLESKVQAYLESGAQRVWLVYPQSRTVTVWRGDRTARSLAPGDVLDSEDAGFTAAGFTMPVSEVFAALDTLQTPAAEDSA